MNVTALKALAARVRTPHQRTSVSPNEWALFALMAAGIALGIPDLAFAASPFATGAGAATTNFLTIVTPFAVLAIMVTGVMAWFGMISWRWLIGALVGTVLVFGAPQIVAWIRGMAGV